MYQFKRVCKIDSCSKNKNFLVVQWIMRLSNLAVLEELNYVWQVWRHLPDQTNAASISSCDIQMQDKVGWCQWGCWWYKIQNYNRSLPRLFPPQVYCGIICFLSLNSKDVFIIQLLRNEVLVVYLRWCILLLYEVCALVLLLDVCPRIVGHH